MFIFAVIVITIILVFLALVKTLRRQGRPTPPSPLSHLVVAQEDNLSNVEQEEIENIIGTFAQQLNPETNESAIWKGFLFEHFFGAIRCDRCRIWYYIRTYYRGNDDSREYVCLHCLNWEENSDLMRWLTNELEES